MNMNANFHAAIALVAAAALAACTAPAGGRWPREGVVSPAVANPPAPVVPAEFLQLTMSTERTQYLVGEPVYVALDLENSGVQTERVVGSLDPIDGAVDVLISAPDERTQVFGPLVEADNDEGILVELASGARIGDVVPIFFGARGWTFASPGRYVLTAVYQTPDRDGRFLEATSPPVTIEIQPSSVGENLIRSDERTVGEVGKFLTWRSGDHLEQGQARLREVLQQSPASPHASYIHAAFAHSFSEPFMDYRRGEVRPANCDLAMRELAQVDSTRLPTYLRLQNAMVGARCALAAEDWDAAQRYLDQAEEIAAGRPEYRGLAARIAELETYLNEAAR
jgi:hypothetical protein